MANYRSNYEVRGYVSGICFNERRYVLLDTNITNKREALRQAKRYLSTVYPIVKVTDSIEFDEILTLDDSYERIVNNS